jgi:hypothetical protein
MHWLLKIGLMSRLKSTRRCGVSGRPQKATAPAAASMAATKMPATAMLILPGLLKPTAFLRCVTPG